MTLLREFAMRQRSSPAPLRKPVALVDRMARRPSIGRWMIYFVVGAVALTAFVLLVLWASNGFQELGIATVGVIALIMGSLVTTALGIALMGLLFYSDRSGTDEFVYHSGDTKQGPVERNSFGAKSRGTIRRGADPNA